MTRPEPFNLLGSSSHEGKGAPLSSEERELLEAQRGQFRPLEKVRQGGGGARRAPVLVGQGVLSTSLVPVPELMRGVGVGAHLCAVAEGGGWHTHCCMSHARMQPTYEAVEGRRASKPPAPEQVFKPFNLASVEKHEQ